MTGGYEIEPRTLRTAAAELQRAGEQLAEQWTALKATVAGMGQPWGGDDIGMLIGMSYTAVEATADESYTGAADDLTRYAEKLEAVADNHEKAEQQNVAEVKSISALLNGG